MSRRIYFLQEDVLWSATLCDPATGLPSEEELFDDAQTLGEAIDRAIAWGAARGFHIAIDHGLELHR